MGSDETVALTAFVTIALHHGLAVFQDEGAEELKQRVVRTVAFLPSAGPQFSPFFRRNPGVQAPDLHPVFFQEASISKANSFLGEKASAGLLGAHAAAITAYALTLTKASGDLRGVAHNNLMAMAQETGGEGRGAPGNEPETQGTIGSLSVSRGRGWMKTQRTNEGVSRGVLGENQENPAGSD